jgi:cytochrome c oxidase assembly protein subunit 11
VQARRITASIVIVSVAAMMGMAYAAVPLYQAFCKATGYGGTTQTASAAPNHLGKRSMTVRFDANVAPGLNWNFTAETPAIELQVGKTATVFFHVQNLSDTEIHATAAYNVAPEVMGSYFDKITCFCFSEQKLAPHEAMDMPVVFFLDPALDNDQMTKQVDSVTLSYTFFASKKSSQPVALQAGTNQPKL